MYFDVESLSASLQILKASLLNQGKRKWLMTLPCRSIYGQINISEQFEVLIEKFETKR